MRKAVRIEVTEGDREVLERWSRSRIATVRLRERSRMVLMAAGGMTNTAIARELGTHTDKVGRWRRRYADKGIKGIEKERPRGGNHGGRCPKAQAALRDGDHPPHDAGDTPGRDALVVPVDGEGGGHDAQLREHGVALGGAEAPSVAHLQGEHGSALRGKAARRCGRCISTRRTTRSCSALTRRARSRRSTGHSRDCR